MFKTKGKNTETWYREQLDLLETERKKMLLSFSEREEMRKTQKFSSTNNLWNDGRFNLSEKIGEICSLTKEFDKTECGHSYEEWEKFYLENGKNIHDIYKLSLKFMDKCSENNISLDESEALNYCYIRIIDESYIGYIREHNAITRLRNTFSDCKFYFTSSHDDMKCGIDIGLYSTDGHMIGGFQVKSVNALRRRRIANENNVRFEVCENEHNFRPIYLEIDENEDMSDDMKNIVENYIINQKNLFSQA